VGHRNPDESDLTQTSNQLHCQLMPLHRVLARYLLIVMTSFAMTLTAFADTEPTPTTSSEWFEFGNDLFTREKYEDAISAYRHTIELQGPLVDYARLNLAKCERNLGKDAEAKPILETLSKETKDEDVRSESAKVLLAIDGDIAAEHTNPLSSTIGILDLSAGYNSNIFMGMPGFPNISAPTADLSVTLEIPFLQKKTYTLSTDVIIQDDEIIGYPDFRTIGASFFPKWKWFSHEYSLEVGPEGQIFYIGTTPYIGKLGGQAHVSRTWQSDTVTLGGNIDKDYAPSSLYSYVAGTSALISLVYTHTFSRASDQLVAEGNLSYWSESNLNYSSGDLLLPLTYTGPSAAAGLQYSNASPWTLGLRFTYYFRDYTPDEQPDEIKRIDNAEETTLRCDYRLNKTVSLYFSGVYLRNNSTLGSDSASDENFNDFRAQLGASWRFL
jgi:hypothetical protein